MGPAEPVIWLPEQAGLLHGQQHAGQPLRNLPPLSHNARGDRVWHDRARPPVSPVTLPECQQSPFGTCNLFPVMLGKAMAGISVRGGHPAQYLPHAM